MKNHMSFTHFTPMVFCLFQLWVDSKVLFFLVCSIFAYDIQILYIRYTQCLLLERDNILSRELQEFITWQAYGCVVRIGSGLLISRHAEYNVLFSTLLIWHCCI